MKCLTLIIKPTLLCNCACKYCITPQIIPRNKMSPHDIEVLCQKISNSAVYDSFTFIWHGGEPLLMGIDFYKEVFKIQKRILNKCKYQNTFQTNCTLINDDWMKFFIDNHLMISASLDGDKESHDANRIKKGKGTFDEVFKKILDLQSTRLLAGVVTVLSKTNIKNIKKILEFFSANNISTRLNPILPTERVLSNEEELGISAIEYADCLTTCFDEWMQGKYNDSNGKPLHIAPLTDIIHNILNPSRPHLCTFSGTCYNNFLGLNPLGDLYNCGRFCDIEEFKIANINDSFKNIDDIFETKKSLTKWHPAQSKDDRCLNCEWFPICNRGCPNSSYIFCGKVKNHDPYCDGYKKLFAHIYKYLKDELTDE